MTAKGKLPSKHSRAQRCLSGEGLRFCLNFSAEGGQGGVWPDFPAGGCQGGFFAQKCCHENIFSNPSTALSSSFA